MEFFFSNYIESYLTKTASNNCFLEHKNYRHVADLLVGCQQPTRDRLASEIIPLVLDHLYEHFLFIPQPSFTSEDISLLFFVINFQCLQFMLKINYNNC